MDSNRLPDRRGEKDETGDWCGRCAALAANIKRLHIGVASSANIYGSKASDDDCLTNSASRENHNEGQRDGRPATDQVHSVVWGERTRTQLRHGLIIPDGNDRIYRVGGFLSNSSNIVMFGTMNGNGRKTNTYREWSDNIGDWCWKNKMDRITDLFKK